MSELIDRQAAIEELKSYIIDPKKAISENPDDVFQYNAGIRTAVGVIMELPAASPWHRVEERLPNVGELVVGLDADGHAEITMLSESKCWLTYGLWIHNLGCYVWWMSLPEPPKEDA